MSPWGVGLAQRSDKEQVWSGHKLAWRGRADLADRQPGGLAWVYTSRTHAPGKPYSTLSSTIRRFTTLHPPA